LISLIRDKREGKNKDMVDKVSRHRVQEHSFKKRDKKVSAKQMLKLK
jgi:hypothetical protein